MGRPLTGALRRLARAGVAIGLLATFPHPGAAIAQGATTVLMQQNSTYGTILTDPSGYTLYTWDGDEAGVSNCTDACATAWPPYTVDTGDIAPPDGLPASLGLIERDDGSWQVSLDNWPLYHFVRDANPGDTNGDGVNGFGAAWSVASVAPPVSVVVTTPPVTAPVVQPPAPPTAPPVMAPPPPPPPPPPTATPIVATPTATSIPARSSATGPNGNGQQPYFNSQNPYGPQGPYGPMGPGPQMPPPPPPPMLAPPPPPPPPFPPFGGASVGTVTAVAAAGGTVTLTWQPAPNATTYRIYESTAVGVPSFTLAPTASPTVGALTTTATVSGLTPGTTYVFQVRGVDPSGIEFVVPAQASSSAFPSTGIIF